MLTKIIPYKVFLIEYFSLVLPFSQKNYSCFVFLLCGYIPFVFFFLGLFNCLQYRCFILLFLLTHFSLSALSKNYLLSTHLIGIRILRKYPFLSFFPELFLNIFLHYENRICKSTYDIFYFYLIYSIGISDFLFYYKINPFMSPEFFYYFQWCEVTTTSLVTGSLILRNYTLVFPLSLLIKNDFVYQSFQGFFKKWNIELNNYFELNFFCSNIQLRVCELRMKMAFDDFDSYKKLVNQPLNQLEFSKGEFRQLYLMNLLAFYWIYYYYWIF